VVYIPDYAMALHAPHSTPTSVQPVTQHSLPQIGPSKQPQKSTVGEILSGLFSSAGALSYLMKDMGSAPSTQSSTPISLSTAFKSGRGEFYIPDFSQGKMHTIAIPDFSIQDIRPLARDNGQLAHWVVSGVLSNGNGDGNLSNVIVSFSNATGKAVWRKLSYELGPTSPLGDSLENITPYLLNGYNEGNVLADGGIASSSASAFSNVEWGGSALAHYGTLSLSSNALSAGDELSGELKMWIRSEHFGKRQRLQDNLSVVRSDTNVKGEAVSALRRFRDVESRKCELLSTI
jgi:hypothetical protein